MKMNFLRYLCGVCFILGINGGVEGNNPTSVEPNLPRDIIHMTPVKVASRDGEPLLTFYMVESSLEPKIEVLMDSDFTASFDYSVICADRNVSFVLEVSTENVDTLVVKEDDLFTISCANATKRAFYTTPLIPGFNPKAVSSKTEDQRTSYATNGRFNVKFLSGVIGYGTVRIRLNKITNTYNKMGSTDVTYNILTEDGNVNTTDDVSDGTLNTGSEISYTITIIRKVRVVDRLFRLVVYCVQIFVATGFGAKLDLKVVKENLVRPIAPAIGLGSQFILMPLIAFTVAKAVPMDTQVVALGIFVAGCCPGGGASNMYSYLLRGDLSLSITMTALSTVLALGMLPLWVYTLGTVFTAEEELSVPFEMVAVSLSILITPLLFGLFLRHKFPKVANFVEKLLKPVIVVMSLILIVVGIYSNLYIFRLFKPRIVLAACLLPYIGYITGGIVAAICRQPWTRIKTIAIETGMQNTSIAYILLVTSFPAPIGDIAAVAPVASAVMTPLPLFLTTIVYLTYQRCKKKRCPDNENDKENKDVDDNSEDENEKLTAEMTSPDNKNGKLNEKDQLTDV